MATIKKATTKKPVTKKVIEKKEATMEDAILGNVVADEEKTVVDYENVEVTYKVTNLKNGNTENLFNGSVIETFIGSHNAEARIALKNGEKQVITKNKKGEDAYKIEVV